MHSEPDIEIPLTNDESSGSFSEGEDILMSMETRGGSDFMAIQQPRPLGRMESFQKEKHISVDPISLKGATVRQASFTLVSPQHDNPMKPPPKLKFVSTSLPSSTSSSPRSASNSLLKKIWKNENEGSPRLVTSFSRQDSSIDDSDLASRESGTRRTKSLSDGKASNPIDDFDLLPDRPITKQAHRKRYEPEDGFKCGKLCLFLPRGKGKAVKPSSRSSVSPLPPPPSQKTRPQMISRTVSLERFDCGSPSSDAEREPTNLFFDLPLELMRCSVSDMQSPVTTAFVFNKDDKRETEPKGVLKNTSGGGQCRTSKSQDPTRHVRFSTSSPTTYPSSPTCITPRLRKATQDFNAFLEHLHRQANEE